MQEEHINQRVEQLKEIVHSRFNWQYRYLNLCGEDINDDDINILLENKMLHQEISYITINSQSVKVSPCSLQALIQYLPYLNIFHLTTSQLNNEDTIININAIPHLYQLSITQLQKDHCIHFTKMGGLKWEKLGNLMLSNIGLGFQGFKNLTKSSMPNLASVSFAAIKDSEMAHLTKAQWPNLKKVDIIRNLLTFDEIKVILKANWKTLEYIDVRFSNIQKQHDDVTSLIHPYLPNCKIESTIKKKKPVQLQPKKKKKNK